MLNPEQLAAVERAKAWAVHGNGLPPNAEIANELKAWAASNDKSVRVAEGTYFFTLGLLSASPAAYGAEWNEAIRAAHDAICACLMAECADARENVIALLRPAQPPERAT